MDKVKYNVNLTNKLFGYKFGPITTEMVSMFSNDLDLSYSIKFCLLVLSYIPTLRCKSSHCCKYDLVIVLLSSTDSNVKKRLNQPVKYSLYIHLDNNLHSQITRIELKVMTSVTSEEDMGKLLIITMT